LTLASKGVQQDSCKYIYVIEKIPRDKKLMTFKQTLNFIIGLEGSTFVLIAALTFLFFLLGLICIWFVAMLYSGLSFEQYLNIFIR